ncbi:MAG: hypothetical protein SNJ76_12740 [Fimbriimonadaceae bacterium]
MVEPVVFGLCPTATNLAEAVADFASGGPGIATAFRSEWLPALRMACGETEDVEAVSLGDLAGRTLEWSGRDVGRLVDSEFLLAAMAHALERLPEDSPFAASAEFPGTRVRLLATLAELRQWGWTAVDLERSATRLESADSSEGDPSTRHLVRKLRSLALLQTELDDACSRLRLDLPEQRLMLSGSRWEEEAPRPRILIWAGADAHPAAVDWAVRLGRQGCTVQFALEWHPGNSAWTEGARRTLIQIERLIGRPLSVRPVGDAGPLPKRVFTSPDREFPPAPSGVRPTVEIDSAADVLAESEWALRAVLDDLREGVSAESIAIYVRRPTDYAPLIRAAALRLGVRVHAPWRTPLLTNPLARLVLQWIEGCASPKMTGLEQAVGGSYWGLNADQTRSVQGAVRDARRRGPEGWKALRDWLNLHPEIGCRFEDAWRWRIEAADELPLAGHFQALKRWLSGDRLAPALAGDCPTGPRDEAAVRAMLRPIESRVALGADTRLFSLPEFARICRKLWEVSELRQDGEGQGVRVVSDAAELGPVSTVVVLGMLEGSFPRRRSEDPVLSDVERESINRIDPSRPPLMTSHDRVRSEREELVRIVAAPSRRLVFFYPQSDDNRDNVPAFYLNEIERAMSGEVKRRDFPRAQLTPTSEEAVCPADRRLAAALAEPTPVLPTPTAEHPDALAAIRKPPDTPWTLRDIRASRECDFRFAFEQQLRLRDQESGPTFIAFAKLPEAGRLLLAPDRETARASLEAALESELADVASEISDEQLAMLRAEGKRRIREWIEREFLAREIWPKTPGSVSAGPAFGSELLASELPTPGGPFRLAGTIAATSRTGPYLVGHLLGQSRSISKVDRAEDIKDADRLLLGTIAFSLCKSGQPVAIEADGASAGRTLYVLTRETNIDLLSRQDRDLRVVELTDGSNRKEFFRQIKDQLADTMRRAYETTGVPNAGEHCRFCTLGELCRRHLDFSEEVAFVEPDVE